MPLNANTAPYYDDFDTTKNFHRILFNPGRPVQARELTQLQTILQNQIERFGDHVFRHGAAVLGGKAAHSNVKYIQLADYEGDDAVNPAIDVTGLYNTTTLSGARIVLDDNVELARDADDNVITSDGRSPVAVVTYALSRDGSTPNTLIVTYESEDEFQVGDTIKSVVDADFTTAFDNAVIKYDSQSGADAAVGDSMIVTLTDGVFYIKSSTGTHFVHTPSQRIVISKYNKTATYSVGLKVVEKFVTESDDSSLNDNAGGIYQPTAPGAHRLQITLNLQVKPGSDGVTIDPDTATDYVELMVIENGIRIFSLGASGETNKVYSEVGKAMARRTHDAEGNFIVDPFICRVEETVPSSDQLRVTLTPAHGRDASRAYVNGQEFALNGTWSRIINKARGTAIKENLITPTPIGSFITVRDLEVSDHLGEGVLDAGKLPVWDIHSVSKENVNVNSESEYNSTRIGSFRLRDLKTAGRFGNAAAANVHTMYIQDFRTSNALSGNFDDVSTDGGKTVHISLTGRNTTVNAYVGARISITGSELDSQTDYANQTRVVIASDAGGTLTLNQPFNQPPSNTTYADATDGTDTGVGFPGEAESYSLVLEPVASMTGNGCVVPSPIVGHDVAIGGGVYNPARVSTANANMMNSADGYANTHPIRGGDQVGLLFPIATGGSRVANSIAEAVTGGSLHHMARLCATSTSSGDTVSFDADQFRLGTANYTEFVEGITSENVVLVLEEVGAGDARVIDRKDFSSFSATSSTITIASSLITNAQTLRLYAPVNVNGTRAKRKTLRQGFNTRGTTYTIVQNRSNGHVIFDTPNRVPGGSDNLGMPDVYRLRAVIDTGSLSTDPTDDMLNNSAYDITSRYSLNDGQREDLYDYASITLKPGAPSPVGKLLVVYDYFSHTDETGADPEGGFFSVDSYHNQVKIEDIPSFTSTTSGIRYHLKDYIDFRPVRATDLTGTSTANASYYTPIVPTPQTNPVGSYSIGQVDAAGAFLYYMQYFAARFDRIILGDRQSSSGSNTGTIQIVSGSTTQSPATMPYVSQNDLALFTLTIPSYTKQASDVIITKDTTRRYSMGDIDKLEKRITRLERIASMSAIEQQTTGLKIVDDDGIEYFKNGILVDTFEGFSSSDVGVPGAPNPQFNASVGNGMLRPAVEQDNLDMILDRDNSSNFYAKNGIAMLPFTTTRGIRGLSQIQATQNGGENVNPFQIQPFYGEISLTPSSDNWKSTRDLPVSVADRNQARMAAESLIQDRLDRGEGDTVWGSWEDTWFGAETEVSTFFKDPEAAYQYVLDNPPESLSNHWLNQILFRDNAGNVIWNPVDGYSYAQTAAGFRPGVSNLRQLESNAIPAGWDYIGGEVDWVRFHINRNNTSPDVTVAGQVNVTDELIQRTITTETGLSTRQGVEVRFATDEDTILVDDVQISDIVYPYMRPVDITFRAKGLKPRTTIYPIFDGINVDNYVERANELVLQMNPVETAWSNPFGDGYGDIREEEAIGNATNGNSGMAVGAFANTIYVTSANGTFVAGSTIYRSLSGTTPPVTVVKYKQYSGSILNHPTTTTIQLFDTRAYGQIHWRTTSVGARASTTYSPEVDLYGRKLYIVEGRGYGQNREIIEFDEDTGVVTIDFPWDLQPNTDSRFSIGELYSDLAGQSYGVFYVPNYSYANRTAQEYIEALNTDDEYWNQAAVSDQRTNDRLRFPSGQKNFSLRSSPDPFESDLTTHVEGVFSSTGTIDTFRYRSVFDIIKITTDIAEQREISRSSTEDISLGQQLTGDTIKYFDPVAQSFVIDHNLHPGGVFINAVDIWFQTKHRDNAGTQLPITLEIRPTSSGVPSGSKVLASKTLLPSAVTTTSNPTFNTGQTTFTFDRPLMLEAGQEYAIVLRSDSLDYVVWTAKMGDALVGTGGTTGVAEKIVDKNSHYGSFFKSQNGVTWTAEQDQDLMFAIHKCIFTTDTPSTIIWKTVNAISDSTASATTRINQPLWHPNINNVIPGTLSTPYSNATEFKLWQNDYNFDEFRIDTTTLEFPSSSVNWEYDCARPGETIPPDPFTLEFSETDGYKSLNMSTNTIDPNGRMTILKDKTGSFLLRGTLSTSSPDLSPIVNLERMSLTIFKNIVNNGGLHANTWPYSRKYRDGTVVGGGFYIESGGLGYANTDTLVITTGSGKVGAGAAGNPVTNSTGGIIGFNLTNQGQTYLTAPTISVTGSTPTTGAVISYIGEDDPKHPGNFQARYVSKRVRLKQGVESRDIRVILSASVPETARVHVFAKVRSSMDPGDFDDKPWQLLGQSTSDASQISGDKGLRRELVFRGTGEDDTFPFAYTSVSDDSESGQGERYMSFNEFAIKILMQTSDSTRVPIIYDMRAIAVE